jgi:hypothetical protein
MGRTWREQWADDSLLITIHGGVSIGGIAAPLIVAWAKNMGEIGWIVCVAISGFVIVGSGRYILARAERKGKTGADAVVPVGAKPQNGAPVTFEEGDLVKSSDPAAIRQYVIHKGHRLAIAGCVLVRLAFPNRRYIEGGGCSTLEPSAFKQIPEGRQLMSEEDLFAEFATAQYPRIVGRWLFGHNLCLIEQRGKKGRTLTLTNEKGHSTRAAFTDLRTIVTEPAPQWSQCIGELNDVFDTINWGPAGVWKKTPD